MGKSSSPRSHLWFPYMGLGRWRQLRHRQPLAPLVSYHPFLLLTRMGLRAHKLALASMCVFSFDLRIFKYWLIVIEQTARNLGASTSVSALEINDLPPVSVPAAGVYRVQHILNNRLDCPWRPPSLHFDFRVGDQWSYSCKRASLMWLLLY